MHTDRNFLFKPVKRDKYFGKQFATKNEPQTVKLSFSGLKSFHGN